MEVVRTGVPVGSRRDVLAGEVARRRRVDASALCEVGDLEVALGQLGLEEQRRVVHLERDLEAGLGELLLEECLGGDAPVLLGRVVGERELLAALRPEPRRVLGPTGSREDVGDLGRVEVELGERGTVRTFAPRTHSGEGDRPAPQDRGVRVVLLDEPVDDRLTVGAPEERLADGLVVEGGLAGVDPQGLPEHGARVGLELDGRHRGELLHEARGSRLGEDRRDVTGEQRVDLGRCVGARNDRHLVEVGLVAPVGVVANEDRLVLAPGLELPGTAGERDVVLHLLGQVHLLLGVLVREGCLLDDDPCGAAEHVLPVDEDDLVVQDRDRLIGAVDLVDLVVAGRAVGPRRRAP